MLWICSSSCKLGRDRSSYMWTSKFQMRGFTHLKKSRFKAKPIFVIIWSPYISSVILSRHQFCEYLISLLFLSYFKLTPVFEYLVSLHFFRNFKSKPVLRLFDLRIFLSDILGRNKFCEYLVSLHRWTKIFANI